MGEVREARTDAKKARSARQEKTYKELRSRIEEVFEFPKIFPTIKIFIQNLGINLAQIKALRSNSALCANGTRDAL